MGHGQLVRSLVLLGRSWVRRRPVLSGACRLVASAVGAPTVTVATTAVAITTSTSALAATFAAAATTTIAPTTVAVTTSAITVAANAVTALPISIATPALPASAVLALYRRPKRLHERERRGLCWVREPIQEL